MSSQGIENLEERALLATSSFTSPDLTGLIRQALHHGVNTGPAVIQVMTSSLETQLTNGPLAELQAGTITEPEFETEVTAIVTSYEESVDSQLARFPNISAILKRQGAAIESDLSALAAEQTAGLIDSTTYTTDAANAIATLTNGPLRPLHSPYSAYVTVTKEFESKLDGVVSGLDSTQATPLTVTEAQTLVQAYSDAYQANTSAALYLKPGVQARINQALTDLNTAAANLTDADAQAELQAAVTAFDNAILDTTGLFGPQGPVVWHLHGGNRRHW